MPFCVDDRDSRQATSSLLRRTFVRHDPRRQTNHTVDPGWVTASVKGVRLFARWPESCRGAVSFRGDMGRVSPARELPMWPPGFRAPGASQVGKESFAGSYRTTTRSLS